MRHPLLGPEIKLRRASHHLVELEQNEKRFFAETACRIAFDTETKPGHKLAKIVLDATPPEIMHVLAGEIIYQLRSSLDQTAVAFARLSRGPTKPKAVYFPTGDSPRGFLKACRGLYKPSKKIPFYGGLRHFDHDLRKAILRTRPYAGGNEELRAIFPMAQIDKHMELIAIGAAGSISLMSDISITGANTGFILSPPGDLNKGVIFSDLTPTGSITLNNANAKIEVSGQVNTGDIEPYSNRPLVPLLRSMLEAVIDAHQSFEDLLIRRGDIPPRITYWPSNVECLEDGTIQRARIVANPNPIEQ
ncbi:hypothetical protein ABVV53_13950 [Novosphingobium sp. RD2P27]|uniref:Uncharacterized protein n=1 Tax=Novosphingobium kalidii TaxID=3230299 RepID=A0ABV2D3U5_9SPHN